MTTKRAQSRTNSRETDRKIRTRKSQKRTKKRRKRGAQSSQKSMYLPLLRQQSMNILTTKTRINSLYTQALYTIPAHNFAPGKL
jgi:hypothetical protein